MDANLLDSVCGRHNKGKVLDDINGDPKESVIASKLHGAGSVESQMNLVQRSKQVFTLGQQRVLELEDGDSFLLQTILFDEDDSVLPRWRYRSASQIAARLSSWARRRHVLITYCMIDKNTVRIWRLGAV